MQKSGTTSPNNDFQSVSSGGECIVPELQMRMDGALSAAEKIRQD